MSEVILEGCEVGEDAVLGEPGGGMAVFQLVDGLGTELHLGERGGRHGAAARAIDRVRAGAQAVRQVDRGFQAVANPLVDMKIRLETARLLLYRLAWLLDSGRPATLDSRS